jgi:hypothetical protein
MTAKELGSQMAQAGFEYTDGRGCAKVSQDVNGERIWENFQPGLSKRELFAAMAMQGLLSSPCDLTENGKHVGKGQIYIAKFSVEMADSLLAELAKKQP